MMGIMVAGLNQLSQVFTLKNIFWFEQIKNGIHSINLSLNLNWLGINFSFLSPILLFIFISVVAILIFLYKTSEVINKKVLGWIFVIVIFVFVLAQIQIWRKNRPPELKFRLSFLPVQTESDLGELNWIGDALWIGVARQLQTSVGDKAVVCPAQWTREIIKSDSIHNSNYLKKLNQQINIEYLLIGKLFKEESFPRLTYQIIDAGDGTAVLEKLLSLNPQDLPETTVQISAEILNYFDMPLKIQQSVIRHVSSDAYQYYLNGEKNFQQKKYQTAIDFAQKAIASDSGVVEAYALMGKSYFMKALKRKEEGEAAIEEFERAKNWLNRVVAMDSTYGDVFTFLGEYYIYQERWALAEQMLKKSYMLNPNNPRLHLSLSRLHEFRFQKLGFNSEEKLYKRAIFINPCYEDAYLMLSDYYLFNNKRKQAIEVLETIREIKPNSVPVLMALGKIYLVRNDILKIIEIYNRVLELEPNNSDAYYNLGILYYNSKDYENAEKFLLRAVAIDNHLNAHLYLAYLYEMEGEYDKAIEHLRTRIRNRKGLEDEFAEEARKHLFKLLHRDSSNTDKAKE